MAGDVNSDGSVDVLDVITVVNIILEVLYTVNQKLI